MSQSEPNVIVILVGNQKDRQEHREVSLAQAEEFKKKHQIPFFIETSAKSGENVETVFLMASKILYSNYKDKIESLVSVTHSQSVSQRE